MATFIALRLLPARLLAEPGATLDWTALSEPRAMTRLFSVAVMVGLSAWLLWLRPRNHAHRGLAFFLTSFGVAVFCNTMGAFAAEAAKPDWFRLTKFAEFLELPSLLYFIASYPRPRGTIGQSPLFRWGLLVAAVAVEVAMYRDPSIWVTSADASSGLAERIGPANSLSKDNFWLAVVAIVLAYDYGRLQPGPRRSSLLLVWLGFALNSLYDSSTASLYRFQNSIPLPEFFWNQVTYYLDNVALALGFVAVAVMLWSMARARGATYRSDLRLLALTLPLPILAAWLETLVAPNTELFRSPFKMVTNGLVRVSLALLPTYALVRYRVFDIDLQVKASLRRVLILAMFAAVALVGVLGIALLFQQGPPAYVGAVAALALLPFLAPVRRVARTAVDALLPQVEADHEYFEKRKLDLYRAALEDAILDRRRGAGKEDEFLRELRRKLGVSPAEHRALVALARKGVDPLPATTQPPPRFEIQRELGRGSSGAAILAHDSLLDRLVVLKRPLGATAQDAHARDQWLREAQMAASVQHPNVVTLLEVLPDEDPPAIVLQYVAGGSLQDLLARDQRLRPERAVAIAIDACRGVAAIHDAGIVHRDLKPANILLAPDGAARITDFGIARPPPGKRAWPEVSGSPSQGDAEETVQATRALPGYGAGSLLYMAPEQLDGGPVDGRADVYAVGAILFEMLTGLPPLELRGLSTAEMHERVRRAEPRFGLLPGLLAPIVMRALAKDPRDRFAGARAMEAALEEARAALAEPSPP